MNYFSCLSSLGLLYVIMKREQHKRDKSMFSLTYCLCL